MIKVTENACKQIKSSMKMGDAQALALRVAAMKEPDGSFRYAMGFDHVKPEDVVIEVDGVQIVYAPDMNDLIDNMTIEFDIVDGGEAQFLFLNPNDPAYVPPTE